MLGRISERGLVCVVVSLATGCFSEPPPAGEDASGEDASTAAMGTENAGSGGSASTGTGGESASATSGPESVGSTGSTGTEVTSTAGMGTDTEAEDTGADTGPVPDCTMIYLNFDGVTLSAGPEDDAAANVSSIPFTELTTRPLLPYTGNANVVVDAVSAHLAAFNVCLVTTRPAAGDYEMIVITDTDPPLKFVTALSAAADCGNSNPREISFVFGASGPENVPPATSSRIGFHIGLENGSDPSDLMGPAGDPEALFVDACTGLNSAPACGAQHSGHCSPGNQNTFQELLDAFGPAMP